MTHIYNRGPISNQAGNQYISGDAYIGVQSPADIAFRKLPVVAQARLDCYERRHDSDCLPNTRVDLLRKIREWADGKNEKPIFWLRGLAGTGKSCIARTIAHEYYQKHRLAATFFFSRDIGGDVRHARKFFTSIAAQLAEMSEDLKGYICDAIAQRSDITTQAPREQWRQLILGPLSKLKDNLSHLSLVLVVDALDECDDEDDIRAIVQLLSETRSLTIVRLRILLTSRPEVPIRQGFNVIPKTDHQDFILQDISRSIVDEDIHVFMEYHFAIITQQRGFTLGWPGEETIRAIVQHAAGLFIWATTACRFIKDGGRFTKKRLYAILNGNASSTAPERGLDGIYFTVLEGSIRPEFDEMEQNEHCSMLREVLGAIVILFSALSTTSLTRLVSISKEDIDESLEDLHAILDIRREGEDSIRLHHPSFRDFLLNKKRCHDMRFWVDERKAHELLADGCIRLMSAELKRDVCNLQGPGVLAKEISDQQRESGLPVDLQYACQYWVQHLKRSEAQLQDNDKVDDFLRQHLLHWVEALSLIGKTSEGVHGIILLTSMIRINESPRLYSFIQDTKRFLLYNRSIIEKAPLQTYWSALIFAPQQSLVRIQFENEMPCSINRLGELQYQWSSLLQTLEGHTGWVNAVAISPDGRAVVSASGDCTVRLWEAATGAALQTLEGHTDWVGAVAFSPDGRAVVSASDDRTVRLWDTATGEALQTLEGYTDSVNAVAFSPDGRAVVSASDDRTVRLWDVATGEALQTLEGHTDSVSAITFSPDGKAVVSASDDRTVRLWDVATGEALQTLEGHTDSVSAITFSPDGKAVVSASDDRTVRLWEAATGEALQTLEGHTDPVNAVAFSPDGRAVVSASDDRTVRLWDVATGEALQTLEGHTDSVSATTFSPDGRTVVSASDDRTVRLWDTAMGEALQTLEGHTGSVSAVAFSPDGRVVVSASDDRTIRLWETATGEALQTLEGHTGRVNAVAFSSDGRAVVSASRDRTMRLWEVTTGAVLQALEGHTGWVNAVAFSPDGRAVASASNDSTVRLWDVVTGAALQTLKGHTGWVKAVAFSPDGRAVASASDDCTVRLWDTPTGAALQALVGHTDWVNAIAFSPDGRAVVSASDDRTMRLWDTATGAALQTLKGYTDSVRAVTFSPDGRAVVSASNDRTVRLWDTATGIALQTLEGHTDRVRAITFSPDGRVVASASDGRTMRLWDAVTGAVLQTLENSLIKRLASSKEGPFLEADRGLLHIESDSTSLSVAKLQPLYTVSVRADWITRGETNILWLPPEYRPSCSAFRSDLLFLGHRSGKVTFIKFSNF